MPIISAYARLLPCSSFPRRFDRTKYSSREFDWWGNLGNEG